MVLDQPPSQSVVKDGTVWVTPNTGALYFELDTDNRLSHQPC